MDRGMGKMLVICKSSPHHTHLIEQLITRAIRIRLMLDIQTKDRIDTAVAVEILIVHLSRLLRRGPALGVEPQVAGNDIRMTIMIQIGNQQLIPPAAGRTASRY